MSDCSLLEKLLLDRMDPLNWGAIGSGITTDPTLRRVRSQTIRAINIAPDDQMGYTGNLTNCRMICSVTRIANLIDSKQTPQNFACCGNQVCIFDSADRLPYYFGLNAPELNIQFGKVHLCSHAG